MKPKQIEAQHAKFEAKHPVPEFMKQSEDYNNLFKVWLSAIESNEEVIRKADRVVRAYKNNTGNEPSVSLLGYAVDELQLELEKQGFNMIIEGA